MIIRYNKLVRDRIPEIIESSGKSCATVILSNEEYLRIIFRAFKKEKEKLLLLDRNNLSFLLLEIMNSYFFARKDNCSVRSEIHFYYHVGGVFNALDRAGRPATGF